MATGLNLSYEDAIALAMKRTGQTRAQVVAAGDVTKVRMEAKLEELLAADRQDRR